MNWHKAFHWVTAHWHLREFRISELTVSLVYCCRCADNSLLDIVLLMAVEAEAKP